MIIDEILFLMPSRNNEHKNTLEYFNLLASMDNNKTWPRGRSTHCCLVTLKNDVTDKQINWLAT